MKKIQEKEAALEKKNKELEERKRQIEEELKKLNADDGNQDIDFGGIHQEVEEEYEEQF